MPKIFSTIVELLRLDKPVGYLLVFFPALFGLFLAYEEPIDLYYIPVLFVGSVLARSSGCVINDFFDVRIDKINRPDQMVLTKEIPLKKAPALHLWLTLAGFATGFAASWYAGSLKLSGFHLAIAATLWFYSSKYKHKLLTGNLIVAVLSAAVILIVWLFEFYALRKEAVGFSGVIPFFPAINHQVMVYSGFAFLLHFIREIAKDVVDIEGDKTYQCKSIPTVLGLRYTRRILLFLTIITTVLILIYLPFYHSGLVWPSLAYVSVFVLVPILLVLQSLLRDETLPAFEKSEKLLKFAMVSGSANLLFLCFL